MKEYFFLKLHRKQLLPLGTLFFACLLVGSSITALTNPPTQVAEAQTSPLWAQSLGTSSFDDTWRGLDLACENFIGSGTPSLIVAGQTGGTMESDDKDPILIHISTDVLVNGAGKVDWSKQYDISSDARVREIERTQCEDSDTNKRGYVIVGQSKTSIHGGNYNDLWVMRVKLDGTPLWSYIYGKNFADVGHAIVQYPNADNPTHYFIAGTTATSGTGDVGKDFFIVKINAATGALVTSRTWVGSGMEDAVRDLKVLSVGSNNLNLLLAGFKKSNQESGDAGDVWLIMMDSNLNMVNSFGTNGQRTYGGAKYEEAAVILERPNGNIIIMEETESFSATNRDAWIFTIDSTGNVLPSGSSAQKRWHGDPASPTQDRIEEFSAAEFTGADPNLRIVTAGQYEETSTDRDVWVMKLNADTGGRIWDYRFGGSLKDEAEDMVLMPDGRIAVLGYTQSFPAGQQSNQDLWVLLVGSDGKLNVCDAGVKASDNIPAAKSNTAAPSTATGETMSTPTIQQNNAGTSNTALTLTRDIQCTG